MLEIIVDNRVRFEAKAIPRDALDALKVAFTHKNPDHGKLIAMGRIFAARGVPQVIATWALRDGEFSAPRAGMKRVRAELRKRAIDFRVVDRRTEGEVCARPIVYRGFPLRDHQREMVRIGVERQQCIIRGATGCLSGDTIVELNRAGKSFRCTLRHLVKMASGGASSGKRWDPAISTRIRMRTGDGFIRLGTVSDVYESGWKRTHLVRTAGGKKIRATLDHRFLTETGWKSLRRITIGERVYVDAGVFGEGKERKRKTRYQMTRGMQGHPYAGSGGIRKEQLARGHRSVPTHRVVAEARLSGLSVEEFVARVRAGLVADLVFLDPKKFHVHHIDEDAMNNRPENLVVMSPDAHRIEHGRDGGWKKVTARATLDVVESIGEPRDEMTYDVGVYENDHNFLANDFVVHNSGKTTAMLALVEAIGLNTLVILPNKGLFRQWAKCAEVDLGVVGDALGVIGGGKKRLRPLTIALQSSALARNLADCGDFFGAILIDETQRASAKTIYDVVDALPAKYRIGFSASEKRTDRKEFLIYDLIGHAEYEATREQMQEAGHIVGVEIRVVPTKFAAPWYGAHNGETDFNKLLDAMTIDRDRNELIYALLDAEVAAGEQAIVLTHRREHARDVHRRFAATFGTHAKTGLLLGDGEPGDAEEFERSCEGIESGAMLVSAGTYNALGVGINLPAVAVGVAATPISNNEQLVNQVRGRLCRPAQGKREGRLYVPMDVRVYGMKHIRNLLAWNDRVVVRDGERWVEAREWLRRKSFR